MADVGYKIRFDSGEVISGRLDSNGHAHHDDVPESAATVEYEQRKPKPDAPWDPLQKMVEQAKHLVSRTPHNTNN